MNQSKFLTAKWKNLIMVNYEIDPMILKPYLPHGVELDYYEEKCFVSLVAFQFEETRVLGLRIPGHIHFSEINLRFYVKEKVDNEWVRGVVFISELVPKRMIAWIANLIYHENYKKIKIAYNHAENENIIEEQYHFLDNRINIKAENEIQIISPNSIDEFITEHYFGYTRVSESKTNKYEVEHPRWEVYPILHAEINVDFHKLYGDKWNILNNISPHSMLLAKGSEIQVNHKKTIKL